MIWPQWTNFAKVSRSRLSVKSPNRRQSIANQSQTNFTLISITWSMGKRRPDANRLQCQLKQKLCCLSGKHSKILQHGTLRWSKIDSITIADGIKKYYWNSDLWFWSWWWISAVLSEISDAGSVRPELKVPTTTSALLFVVSDASVYLVCSWGQLKKKLCFSFQSF